MNLTRTTPLYYNITTLGNRLYAQRMGPNVTNDICLTCKNCSHKCAVDCEHLCHTIQHRAVLIIFPPSLQTITITRMLSSGGEGRLKGYFTYCHCKTKLVLHIDRAIFCSVRKICHFCVSFNYQKKRFFFIRNSVAMDAAILTRI